MRTGSVVNPTQPHPSRPRRFRHRRKRGLRSVFSQMAQLAADTFALRDRVVGEAGGVRWRERLDPILLELESMQWDLLETAGMISEPIGEACATISGDWRAQAARLLAECQACGGKVCALVRRASASGDLLFAQCGCAFLRALEKLLWVLRPLTEAGPPYPILPDTA